MKLRFSSARAVAFAGTALQLSMTSGAPAYAAAINSPSQALDGALSDISRQANVSIVFRKEAVHKFRSPALSGDLSPAQAIERVTAGTGLEAVAMDNRSFIVRPRPMSTPIAFRQGTQMALQDAVPPAPAVVSEADAPLEAAAEQDIVVTGSRLASGFAMPTPVVAISTEQLQQTAPTSMAESLRQVPALNSSITSTNSGSGTASNANNGQSILNLRGLGGQRTLVLVDGQRMGVTNVVNSVDINIIPQPLVKRVDIVTGGASASYGSDAVAGAVNFILDTKFEGVKGELSGGVTSRKDAENGHFSLAFGHKIGESSRIIASVDVFRLNGIPYGHTGRKWFDEPVGVSPNPVTGALPTLILVPNTRSSIAGYGGTITAVAGCPAGATGATCRTLVGQQFLDGGALSVFNRGTPAGQTFGGSSDGALITNGLTPDIKRESAFVHFEHDASSTITLWGEGIYSRNYTSNAAQPPVEVQGTAFTIFEGNPYLPAAVASVLAATPGNQTFSLARFSPDLGGLTTIKGVSTVKRFAGGVKGELARGWSFDTTASYQDTLQKLDANYPIMRNLYAAADAVTAPNGQIVCRSTYYNAAGTYMPNGTGLDVGCVPLNLFGPNTISAAAGNYVIGENTGHTRLKQTTLDANLRGDLGEGFSLGAGPISIALGASYRRLANKRTVDPLSALYIDFAGVRGFPAGLQGRYGSYQNYNPSPLKGSVEVKEGYVELGIPILKDRTLFEALSATLAGRLTDYSQSGLEPMWKVGLNWTMNSDVRIRGTVSADTRAPSVVELFNPAQASNSTPFLPSSTAVTQIRGTGQTLTTGNPNLKPEKARTYTAGIVFSPSFIPRFQASIDYYKISISDSIVALLPQDVIDRCFAGDQQFCSQITSNGRPVTTTAGIGANDYVTIVTPGLNLAKESTDGIDFEAAYSLPVGDGRLSTRFSGTYLLSAKVQSGCAGTGDIVGTIGNCGANGSYPRLRARFSANYEVGPFGFYAQERFISGGKKNSSWTSGIDIADNNVPTVWYTDLNLTYRVGKMFGGDGQLFLNVTNLFDRDPPPTLGRARAFLETSDLALYDALGTRFVFGFRFAM